MSLKGLEKPRKLSSRIVGLQAEIRIAHPPNTGQLGFHVNRICGLTRVYYMHVVSSCLCMEWEATFFLFSSKIVLFMIMLLFVCVPDRKNAPF